MTKPGYHTLKASPCNSPEVTPTDRQTTTGIKYNTNFFINKNVKKQTSYNNNKQNRK